MAGKVIYSGEPLPVAPREGNPERAAFDRKILDYLRRLSGKLDRFAGGSGSVEVYSAYFSTNQDISTALTGVEWKIDLRKDAPFEHDTTTNPHKITILEDGFYLVCVDARVSDSATFPANADLTVEYNGAAGSVVYSVGLESFAGTLSAAIPLPLVADIKLNFRLSAASNTAGAILADGTRITVLRLAQDSGGGTSPNPGVGWTGVGTGLPDWAVSVTE